MNQDENSSKIKKARLHTAILIRDVLTNKKNVKTALVEFPRDSEDISIKCAFDALMHREADEDLREKTPDYARVQDDFLADLALLLAKNQDFPQNVIAQYLKYHETDLLPSNQKGLKSISKIIKRMINF